MYGCCVDFQSDKEIQSFVKDVYHVNFPVFGKIDVLGESAPQAWKYLMSRWCKLRFLPLNYNYHISVTRSIKHCFLF